MIVEAAQRHRRNQCSGKRIARFQVTLAAGHLANDTPRSHRSEGIVSKRIVEPLRDFMRGNGGISSATEQGPVTALKVTNAISIRAGAKCTVEPQDAAVVQVVGSAVGDHGVVEQEIYERCRWDRVGGDVVLQERVQEAEADYSKVAGRVSGSGI